MVALRTARQAAGERTFGFVELIEVAERPRRRDSLPEHTRYVDTGCSLHPSCLTCPLARCRYDEPGGARQITSRVRDDAVLRARREEHMPVEAIARRYGISRRTVFRILARAREEESAPW